MYIALHFVVLSAAMFIVAVWRSAAQMGEYKEFLFPSQKIFCEIGAFIHCCFQSMDLGAHCVVILGRAMCRKFHQWVSAEPQLRDDFIAFFSL